jgi:formylglycine-generating enzyme required for sulfatase activity
VGGGSIQIEKETFTVQPFYIAKYPITYRQFEVFVEAKDGFKNAHWWENLSADKDHKSKPGEQNFKFYNHPRETVSWYDAIAFCRWLNTRLGFAELPANLTIKTLDNFKGIRLPAEWEWQWAATGGNPKYEYPWGEEWDGSKANTSESGLGRTTGVGMYPAGSAKCGARDLSGNVWEWCLNERDKLENIGLMGKASRGVRGGSWDRNRGVARASYRDYSGPYSRLTVGFRLVVRPPSL